MRAIYSRWSLLLCVVLSDWDRFSDFSPWDNGGQLDTRMPIEIELYKLAEEHDEAQTGADRG
jgi:hypothetical protein